MVSYGEMLRSARLEKGLDLNKISIEIAIEKRYLEGLENEDSSIFPGEAYFVGFLKNYASYLELDPERLLTLYHNKKIQETPPPKELYSKGRSKKFMITMAVLSVIILACIATFVIIFISKHKPEVDDKVADSDVSTTKQYELSARKFQQRVYKGDQLLIPTDNGGKVVLTINNTLTSLGIEAPTGSYIVDLAEESEIDVNGDDITDMIVYVSDISADESFGAEVEITLHQGISMDTSSIFTEDIPLASDVQGKHPYKVIHEDNRAYPFTVNASFRGPCLFRDKVDNNDSVETYFSRGESFTATPKNGIRLWILNNNTVKLNIIADSKNFDLDIGAPGDVLVEDIKWIKDKDGKYKLVVIELD